MKFKVGDKVRMKNMNMEYEYGYIPQMDNFINKVHEINAIMDNKIFGNTFYNLKSFIVFIVGLTIGDLLINWLFNDTSKIIEFIKKS